MLDRLGRPTWQVLERFRREAEVASRLDHPGICTILDSGTADGVPYIALRYVPGESLDREIAAIRARRDAEGTRDAPFSSRAESLRIARLFERASRATHAAHEAGIVHRDIKPGNIMVTPADEPVLLDFGLARDTAGDRATLTQTGDVFGTPAYMSPEQLRGEGSRMDRRTDVYSLGASLFERLTLRTPFEASTREGLYRAILEEEVPNPRTLNRALSRVLAVVVMTALEKDRDRRFQSALDFAEDLARVCRNEPIHDRPVTTWLRARRWIQRNRTVASLAALLIVVLSVSVVVISSQNRDLASELENARAGRSSKRQRQLSVLIEQGYQRLFGANPTGADFAFDQALALEPGNKTALFGRFWFDVYGPEKALAVLDRVPPSLLEDPDVLWMRGVALEMSGLDAEAQALFDRAGDASVVNGLEGLGPSTVGELARHLGRVPETLYYHVRNLVRVGLVIEKEQRPSARRAEMVYALPGPILRIDSENRSAQWIAGLERVVSTTVRDALRDQGAALRDPATVRAGKWREVRFTYTSVRLRKRPLARLNGMLEELAEFLRSEHERGEGRFYSVTTLVAPKRAALEEGERILESRRP